MRGFTYKDYLYYKEFLSSNQIKRDYILMEEGEQYSYEEKVAHQPHDKIFKEILDNKKEAVNFINEVLTLKNTKYELKEENIEKYNRKFITKDFYNKESDVTYKKKDQNIFFLIEHQSTIDYSMPYRILEYNMAIMESAIDLKKVKNKSYKLPTIFSFVIYTGNKKWNATNYLINKQEKLLGCELRNFANFQVVDINDYTDKELLESESLLKKIMLLEKAKDYKEVENYLQVIIQKRTDNAQKVFLQRLIKYIFKDKLSNQKLNKFMKELEVRQGKGGEIMFVELINKKIDEVFEMEEKVKEQETKVKEQETKVKEQETKVKEQETKVKAEETKIKAREEKVKQKEVKIEQKELKIKEREKALNAAESQIIIKMLKNNIDENTILKIVDIDKKRLAKIKQDNNFAVVN